MSWSAKKEQVQTKLDEFAQVNQQTMSVEQLTALKQDHESLRNGLTTYLTAQAQNYNLSGKLEETGTLQGQLRELEKERDLLQTEVETALARDEALRTRDTTGNHHTLYLMDRPVRRGMVPFLWALSVIFVGVGVLLFYWLTPALLLPQGVNGLGTYTVTQVLSDVFTSRYTWMALFGAASIIILFLSLKIAGKLGS